MFAVAAFELGWQVTAVDVRTARFPPVAGIAWIEADVRTYLFTACNFDVITLLGILYHLELPDQLALLRRCVGRSTIVDMHVSASSPDEQDATEATSTMRAPTSRCAGRRTHHPGTIDGRGGAR